MMSVEKEYLSPKRKGEAELKEPKRKNIIISNSHKYFMKKTHELRQENKRKEKEYVLMYLDWLKGNMREETMNLQEIEIKKGIKENERLIMKLEKIMDKLHTEEMDILKR